MTQYENFCMQPTFTVSIINRDTFEPTYVYLFELLKNCGLFLTVVQLLRLAGSLCLSVFGVVEANYSIRGLCF